MMSLKRYLLHCTAAWAALLVFFSLLHPASSTVVILIVPFVLLFAALYTSWVLIWGIRARLTGRTEAASLHRRLGMVICLSGVLLLVLQSLGQLSPRDVVTVAAIIAIGYLYLSRSGFTVGRR